MKRWLFRIVAIILIALGLSFSRWFPILNDFVRINSDSIQGWAATIQLLIWSGSGLSTWFGWIKRPRAKTTTQITSLSTTTSVTESGSVEFYGPATGNIIITGDKNVVGVEKLAVDEDALRKAYLSQVYNESSYLTLTGIDRKAASDADTRLSLGAVYTSLRTLSHNEDIVTWREKETSRGKIIERESPRLSALEQLDRNTHLVLLGDPGSGKTTFVNFVALCLAGESLGVAPNLKSLTSPLPQEEEFGDRKDKPQVQPWHHGALLPVRIVLRDFAARGLRDIGQKASAKHLWDFILTELQSHALGDYGPLLHRHLLEKGGLLLFDGLDEVSEADQRREQIKSAVEDFCSSLPDCRVLVTSRTYAYHRQEWRLKGFVETILAPFSKGQIRHFVDRWYGHIATLRRQNAEDAQGRAKLLKKAIFGSDRLLGLAERPLLLTLMASLHAWRGGTLPEKREELYNDTVDLLLDWWEQPKVVRGKEGEAIVAQPSLAEFLRVDRKKLRDLLNKLAYEAHARQPDLQGTADVSEQDLVNGLIELSSDPDLKPARLLEYLRDRAGLLIPRGVGVYTFPHRTFQEYLAACHLTDHEYPEMIAELVCGDFNRWREVALLAGAKASRGTSSAIWSLVEALCFQDLPKDSCQQKHLWGAHLAGQSLVESANLADVSERNQIKVTRVKNWLVHIVKIGELPALERARAGDTLAALGDPRQEVMTVEGMQFCFVPAGAFKMGSQKGAGDDDERPQHELSLPDFWIARFPVTNAQYSKYKKIEHDLPQPFKLPNHPIVEVNWFEVLEFCSWLNVEFKPLLPIGYIISLPSEAEWEKAARGGLLIPRQAVWRSLADGLAIPKGLEMMENPDPGRHFPWLGEFNPEFANTSGSGIGSTSAVGCFPGGESPYGALDLSGNIWEWTRSLFGGYPYPDTPQEQEKRENLKASDKNPRVVRGGSFIYVGGYARCADRSWFYPLFSNRYLGFRVVVSRTSLRP